MYIYLYNYAKICMDTKNCHLPHYQLIVENKNYIQENHKTYFIRIKFTFHYYSRNTLQKGIDNVLCTCIIVFQSKQLLASLYKGSSTGHLSTKAMVWILLAKYWWKTLHKDIHLFCRSCHGCQTHAPLKKTRTTPFKLVLPFNFHFFLTMEDGFCRTN